MNPLFSHRRALQALSAVAGAAAVGCAREEEAEDASGDELTFCGDRMDRGRRELGAAPPLQRYEKFVVLMMENRSFDHFFGHLSMPTALGGEGRPRWDGRTPDPDGKRIDGLAGNEWNPDLDGNQVKIFRPNHYAIGDIDHEWDSCHEQFAGGRNDGFIFPHQRDLRRLNDGNPAILPRTRVSEFDAHETNFASPGQSELAAKLIGGPVDGETKKIYTDKFLQAADRLGVARIRS
jgi:Phosphoesterase family